MESKLETLDVKALKICHIEPNDLEFIDKFMQIEHYEVGLTNLRIYYNCSNPKLWKCLKDKNGEIIAVDIGNLLPNGINYGYILIVKPEHRGKGISNLFKAQWSENPYMGSESLNSLKMYPNILQCWRGKMLIFYGQVKKVDAQAYADVHRCYDIQVENITENNVDKIFDYDKTIIKLDRKKFLKEWCCTKDSQAVMSVKNGKCVGYGVLRNFTGFNGYSISPLYANNDAIAYALLVKLAEYLQHHFLYIPAQSHQRVAIEFCHSLKLYFFSSEIRDCNLAALDYMKTLDMSKVYTTHDYWPL